MAAYRKIAEAYFSWFFKSCLKILLGIAELADKHAKKIAKKKKKNVDLPFSGLISRSLNLSPENRKPGAFAYSSWGRAGELKT